MAEKLIRLPQLQRFKTNADAKYQDKLTAGSNITISGNVISAQTFGQQTLYNATIPSAGWSGTSNTVSVQGIAAGDDVEIVGINPTGLTDQQIQAAKEALSLITYGTTSTNAITFYALNGVPSVDISVTIRKIINGTLSDGVYGNSNIQNHSLNVPANTTTDIYTATGNCKVYVTVELDNTSENTAGDINLILNGTTIMSGRCNPSQIITYARVITATVLMEAGDVLSIKNPFSSERIGGNYRVVPAGLSEVSGSSVILNDVQTVSSKSFTSGWNSISTATITDSGIYLISTYDKFDNYQDYTLGRMILSCGTSNESVIALFEDFNAANVLNSKNGARSASQVFIKSDNNPLELVFRVYTANAFVAGTYKYGHTIIKLV